MRRKMYVIDGQHLCVIMLLVINQTIGQSFNQPKFCASVTWDSDALTFADQYTIGLDPTTVFVNANNSVYVVEGNASQVQIWIEGSTTPVKTIANDLINPYGLFVSQNGDIYIDNGVSSGQVEKWTWSGTSGVPVMNVSGSCYSLFVDSNNTLYCSLGSLNQVVKGSLNNGGNVTAVILGTGASGSASNMFNDNHGIFVDNSFNLYVADSGNDRIQLFQSGQSNGITLVGNGSTRTLTLNYPTAIVLDADGYFYIADTNNNRIVRSDPSGFRCVVGCSGTSGSASNQLDRPSSLSFDNYGNLFVTDQNNARIQKFILATNSCGPSYNQPKFCPTAIWNSDAVTFADGIVVGSNPSSVFVSINNTVYVTATSLNQVQVWLNENSMLTTTISTGLNSSYAAFASIMGDIYIDNGAFYGRIDKWVSNASSSVVEMYTAGYCFGLFIDINDNLYCSIELEHVVMKKTISDDANTSVVIAGTGSSGAASNMLNQPRGIVVDLKLNLYVADCRNNRIQLFQPGQLTGVTAAGSGVTGTMTLSCPTGLVLDADGYLFITDFDKNRIIGSGPNGYRCLLGCTGTTGSLSNQLSNPSSLSFDSYGNLFVADMGNNRIQKFSLATNSCGPSYNQLKFCASATWNPNALTFADNITVGIQPYGLFISTSNTIYVADRSDSNVPIWLKGNTTSTRSLSSGLLNPFSVFATITGDIYVDNGASNGRVDKWTSNASNSTVAMYVSGICYGLFVDIYDNLYCALGDLHQIVKKSSNDNANISTIVAGTGVNGSTADMLNEPQGIFVDIIFNLYVADSGNNRIQLFTPGQLNGTTVVGNAAAGTIALSYPTALVLDSQGHFFIADTNNHRLVGSSANGFRCIVGCSGGSGSGSDQLYFPRSFSFDSSGNLFVTDTNNNRIQKFLLTANSCGRSYNQPKFCTYATWNSNGTTFVDNTTVGSYPSDIFININNSIYVAETNLNQVQVWLNGNSMPTTTISAGLSSTYAVFVSVIGDIYVDNSAVHGQVDKWTTNATSSVVGMYSNGICYDIFADTYDNLYCSLTSLHIVIKKSFNDDANTSRIAAGNSSSGSDLYTLNGPRGIFVDTKFNLYVADCGNNRIQFFQSGQLNGTTLIGNATIGNMTLSCPTGLVLDASGNLFFTDYDNHRIISTGPNGLQCIAGCSGYGSAADQLYGPRSLSFDSYGNIFVTDTGNQRIQKFILASNSCYQTTTSPTIITSVVTIESSSTDIQSTLVIQTNAQSSGSFVPPTCPSSTFIGPSCNISNTPCDMLQPCQNGGSCTNDNTILLGYICSCPPGFDGPECTDDYRLCQSDTCWNNGTCSETSNTTFLCTCAPGWQNNNCELKINYCKNISCLNKGLCRPLLLDFECACLADSYSGRFCEITSGRLITLQAVSKSFAFIAILVIITVALFIVIMDILTYGFGIDLTQAERLQMKQKNYVNNKKPSFITRYLSVSISTIQLFERSNSALEERMI